MMELIPPTHVPIRSGSSPSSSPHRKPDHRTTIGRQPLRRPLRTDAEEMTTKDSGRYRIENGGLSYQSEVYGSWSLAISEISLIGEYTNENGPMADDYFLVFLSAKEPGWFEASFYGEGRDEILKELSDLLGSELSCGLAHSTTFTSQVIWPDEKKGKRVFDFLPSGRFKNRQVLAPGIQDIRSSEAP